MSRTYSSSITSFFGSGSSNPRPMTSQDMSPSNPESPNADLGSVVCDGPPCLGTLSTLGNEEAPGTVANGLVGADALDVLCSCDANGLASLFQFASDS